MIKQILFAATIAAFTAMPASAQGNKFSGDKVPPGHRPPPGMCRIWLEGVPPGQQPAPTDCATAVRNRPGTGRVLFGDDAAGGRKNVRAKDRDDDRGRKDQKDQKDQKDEKDERGVKKEMEYVAVFELGDGVLRPALRILETRSGKRINYQDAQARKAAR